MLVILKLLLHRRVCYLLRWHLPGPDSLAIMARSLFVMSRCNSAVVTVCSDNTVVLRHHRLRVTPVSATVESSHGETADSANDLLKLN